MEDVGLVRIRYLPNAENVDLRHIFLVLAVKAADFIKLALLPIPLADFVPAAVGPDHERHGAPRISKSARKIRLAVAGFFLGPFAEQGEEVGKLAGFEVAQASQWGCRTGHG